LETAPSNETGFGALDEDGCCHTGPLDQDGGGGEEEDCKP